MHHLTQDSVLALNPVVHQVDAFEWSWGRRALVSPGADWWSNFARAAKFGHQFPRAIPVRAVPAQVVDAQLPHPGVFPFMDALNAVGTAAECALVKSAGSFPNQAEGFASSENNSVPEMVIMLQPAPTRGTDFAWRADSNGSRRPPPDHPLSRSDEIPEDY